MPPGSGPYGDEPYPGDQPGHTRAFSIGEDPYAGYGTPSGTGQDGYGQDGYGRAPYGDADDNVAVYRAGGQVAPGWPGRAPTGRSCSPASTAGRPAPSTGCATTRPGCRRSSSR
ncbi:hypothetical protein GCM10025734_43350 [Kitasatospora paranensis]